MDYVVLCVRFEVEVGTYPYPMTIWKTKNRVYRVFDTALFAKIERDADSSVLWEMACGNSKEGEYELEASGEGRAFFTCTRSSRTIVLSYEVDGVVDESF